MVSLEMVRLYSGIKRISLSLASSNAVIPASGIIAIASTATAYDYKGDVMPGCTFAYGLASPYSGISINAAKGVITISSTVQPGLVTVNVQADNVTATAKLRLIQIGGAAQVSNVAIDIKANLNYNFALTATVLRFKALQNGTAAITANRV